MKSQGIESGADNLRGGFATTHWSLIAHAQPDGSAESREALEQLCRQYWFPVYCFARRHCAQAQDAEDLTQGFFADLLSRGALARADMARGKFRTFLLCSFKNFCSHQRSRAGAMKRGGDCAIVSLEAMGEAGECLAAEAAANQTAEKYFDHQWATGMIERALASVRTEYVALGKTEWFDALKAALRGETHHYCTLAKQFKTTPGAAKAAVFRLRRRVAREIRTEVAKTVADPALIDEELRYLQSALTF